MLGYRLWVALHAAEAKGQVPSDEQIVGEERFIKKPMFQFETKSLPYERTPKKSTRDPRQKQVGQTLVDEIAVHFWRTVLPHADILSFLTTKQRSAYFRATCHGPTI